MCFKALKSSGFDLENTHLTDIDRIQKLVGLVMIAFIWCYKVGIYLHEIRPIKIKIHGRKAKSIFKYGVSIHLSPSCINKKAGYDYQPAFLLVIFVSIFC